MDERTFELYRLSVVQSMPDSELKSALIQAIEHKLNILDTSKWTVGEPLSTAEHRRLSRLA